MKANGEHMARKPTPKSIKRLALQCWAEQVKARDNHKCVVCGNPNVEAHHCISRHVLKTRLDIRNGLSLCKLHHKFGKTVLSAHGCPLLFYEWMRLNRPEQYEYLLKVLKQ